MPSHISLFAITSLALTAYSAYFLPLKQGILPNNPDEGPLRFIPTLNGVLSGVVFLDGFIRHGRTEALWIAAIPGIMWCATWIARSWANTMQNTLYNSQINRAGGYPYSRMPNTENKPIRKSISYTFLAPFLKPNKLRTSPTNLRAFKNGIKCNKSLSVGSDIHPSIGIAFSSCQQR
jgi:hypothetical protein